MRTAHTSTRDETFLSTLESWTGSEGEILLMLRFSAAGGAKSFEFFASFAELAVRLGRLAPETSVIAFRRRQLALRGRVDEDFIARCVGEVPEGEEFLVVETVRRVAGKASWFHDAAGVSHAELREALEECRGTSVAAGLYPPWLEDNEEVISAIVPDKDGAVRCGIY